MATYKTYKQLEKKTLKRGDKLVFKVNDEELEYIVEIAGSGRPYLCGQYDEDYNIFANLGIEDGHQFTINYYGYESTSSKDDPEPTAKEDDYKAVTRAALALFAMCEDKEVEIEVPKEVVNIENVKITVPKYIPKPKPIELELNDCYTATIKEDVVVVGCQEIPIDKVKEIVELWNKQFNV